MVPHSPVEIARDYIRRGWMPLPVPFRSKNPGFKEWQKFTVTEAELSQYFNGQPQNIGVLLGEPSGNLIDVDHDCMEAVAIAPYFLPSTATIFGRQTRPRSHWLYIAHLPRKATFTDPVSGKRLVEVLTNGQQAIFPGSTHENTGERIRWDEDGKPARVSEENLLRGVSRLAAATLLALHWPHIGSRQDAALALAGGLLRAGWTEEETASFIGATCGVVGDEETCSRIKTASYTLRKLTEGAQVTGWPTLAKIVDKRVVNCVCEWLNIRTDLQAEVRSHQWDSPEELPDDLLPLPTFDMCLLPEPLRGCIADTAERMQCPVEFPAVASLVAAASLIGNRLRIRPKRADDWTVVPNLWGACVGKPGVLKTPALQEALKPLRARERIARETYQAEMEDFEFQQMRAEAERDLLKKEIRSSIKQGGDGSEYRERLAAAQATQPVERRYIVNDPTVEKLGELLNLNPRGLLLFRDELAGWLRSLDREGREQDRAFYLETWTGHGSYTYDRIGRGTLRVENLTLSMLGSIQPGPLSQYLRAALSGGVGDDGLIQRFQLSVYPNSPKEWRNVDRAPDARAAQSAHECFARLDNLALETIGTPTEDLQAAFLRFEPEAQEFFDGWRAQLENDLRMGAFEHPALEAHMAKYRSLMPSLALIFHLIEVAGGVTAAESVSLEAARRAASWCTVLEAHARRIYGLALNAEVRLAKTILERIRRGDLGAEFTARDIYRRQWAGLSKPSDVTEPLRILEDYGWLRAFSISAGEAGGRPTVSFLAHPSLIVKKEGQGERVSPLIPE